MTNYQSKADRYYNFKTHLTKKNLHIRRKKKKKKNQSLIENSGQSINYYQNRIDYLLPEVAWELWAVSTLAEESRQLPIGYFLSLSYKTQYFLAILSNNTSWISINPRKKRKKEAKKKKKRWMTRKSPREASFVCH